MENAEKKLEALEKAFIEAHKAYQLVEAYREAGMPNEAVNLEKKEADYFVDRALNGDCNWIYLEPAREFYQRHNEKDRADLIARILIRDNVGKALRAEFLHDQMGGFERAFELAKELDDKDLEEKIKELKEKLREMESLPIYKRDYKIRDLPDLSFFGIKRME